MKKNLLIAMIIVLLLGISVTVFALNSENRSENYNSNREASALEMDVCPLEESEPDEEASGC